MKKPNIVFIMADDMGYGDVGCYNPESKIPTPNMDRIAKEGMCFTDAHSPSAVCTPTRYGVLTGRYCWRTRLKRGVLGGYSLPLIDRERLTLAGMLKEEGYHTACIGKWHLGLEYEMKPGEEVDYKNRGNEREFERKINFSRPVKGGPADLGFDYSFFTAACSTCNAPYAFIENRNFVDIPSEFHDNPVYTSRPGLMSPGWEHKDVDPTFAGKAVSYITSRANSETPFFLYLTPSAPHEPCVESVVPEFARGKSQAGPRGDLVWLYDWVVGQVIDILEKTGQADNTLLAVTSDNGALPGDRVLDENGNRIFDEDGEEFYYTYGHKSCGNWRGYKAHIWEGGHREPLIIRFPGQIKPNSVCNEMVGLHDFYATCAELIGRNLSNEVAEDSLSFLGSLTGKPSISNTREDLIHHSERGVFSLRKAQWKLIVGTRTSGGWPPPRGKAAEPGAPGQLYNIENDPAERKNLFDDYPEVVKRLTELLDRYKDEGRSVPL